MKIVNSRQYIVIRGIIVFVFLLSTFYYLLPTTTLHAQDFGLIVCGEDVNGDKIINETEECTFNHLIKLVGQLINAMVIISTFLATGAFAYAGIKLLTSGGNESAMTEAKSIFTKVLIGYLWILFAWLIVYTIISVLLNPGYTLLQ